MASTVNPLSVSVGVDFSLIGTKLHAVYEKNGAEGYAILLAPSKQTADKAVSIGEVIADIRSLINKVDKNADTSQMERDMQKGLSGLTDEQENAFDLNKLMIKLNMAYLYISKTGEDSAVEYAFQLQIISENMIPAAIQELITADNVSISIWNTQRQRIIDRMALISVNEYLGISKQETQQ